MAGKKDPDPVEEPVAEEPPAPAPKQKRGDPWSEACPVCGLLGCRRHA